MDRDASTVVWARQMGDSGGRTSQGDDAEAEQVGKLHDCVEYEV